MFRGGRGHVNKHIIIQENIGCAVTEGNYRVVIGMTLYMLVSGPFEGVTSRQGDENESPLKSWEVHSKQMCHGE